MTDPRARRLQQRLDAAADARTRDWWTRYLKGEAQYRGVPMARIRAETRAWRGAERLDALPPAERVELALELLRQPYAEDQLAGMLWLQEDLLEALPWPQLLERFAPLFADGHLADWGSVDWFSVKVLGPLVDLRGLACARAVARWTRSPRLWQARAGLVAFVYLAGRREFHPLILQGAARLVAREERFGKTAAGWALRELSHQDPGAVEAFVAAHRGSFSREALANATKHLSEARAPPARRATPRISPPGGGSTGRRRRRDGPGRQ